MTFKKWVLCFLPIAFIGCGAENSDKIVEMKSLEQNKVPEWFLNMKNSDEEYVYGKGDDSSVDANISRQRATTDAEIELSRKVGQSINALVKRAIIGDGSFAEGTERIAKSYSQMAKLESKNIIKSYEVHKDEVFQIPGGFRTFICIRINRKDLKEKVFNVLEAEAKKDARSPSSQKILKLIQDRRQSANN